MRIDNIIISIAGLTGVAAAAACSPVHLIVARASGESPGEGISRTVSAAVKKVIPETTSDPVVYPAKMPYTNSMAKGTAELQRMIAAYTTQCPTTKIALIGYSQGASVVIDAMCGGGGNPEIGPHTEGLSKEQGRNVKVMTVFGDPRFVAGMPYNVGTNNRTNGLYARAKKDAECPNFKDIIKSWCDTGDNRCASGSSPSVHSSYLNRYQKAAVDFIVSMVK
ncbi:carbohydrate esterase family 5 protein [Microthyrium microscopicum]|uniref:Carbohydrate esterase family 5 protein n=1 Tax=Microthyrium microscopicum TaxID=703497 RepID=A0A6A6U4C3_9PEZI|nr:carbohydrate esterase family 5 protein [Microthyrium microscopicum]